MTYKQYPKRDAIKNYFPLPNEIFMLGLCSGEISIYSYLLYLENRKTYQCWPSYKTIGKAVDMSQNTVRKYVMSLEEKALIRTEPTNVTTKSGQKRNGSLLYTIRPIQEALDLFYERQMAQAELAAQRQHAMERLARNPRVGPCEPLCGTSEDETSSIPIQSLDKTLAGHTPLDRLGQSDYTNISPVDLFSFQEQGGFYNGTKEGQIQAH